MRHTNTPPRQRIRTAFTDDQCRWCREDSSRHFWCADCRALICARTECGREGEGTVR